MWLSSSASAVDRLPSLIGFFICSPMDPMGELPRLVRGEEPQRGHQRVALPHSTTTPVASIAADAFSPPTSSISE